MRFLLLLTMSLVELAATIGKWLFIVAAPMLLIVTASFCQAGKSCLEPLVGLALLSGMFATTHWLSLKLGRVQLHGRKNVSEEFDVTAGPASGEMAFWNRRLQEEGRNRAGAMQKADRKNQLLAEKWRQSNPWGGYNPHE